MTWTSSSSEGIEAVPASHPGQVLMDELAAMGASVAALSRDSGIPESRLAEIIQGRRGITVDTALRLATYFGTSARFWLDRQATFEAIATRTRRGDIAGASAVRSPAA